MLQPITQFVIPNNINKTRFHKNNTVNNTYPQIDTLSTIPYYLPFNFKRLNSAVPVETTANYIPENKGADHLDLPDVHVFEYPDTNLQVFVNTASDHITSQLTIILESDAQKYNPIKQALVNKLISYKFRDANLEQYYDSNPQSPSFTVSTNWKTPLQILDIPTINLLLTDSQFNNKDLLLAKQELKDYLLSEEYNKKNQLTEIFNKENLYTKEEVLSQIDSIQLNDLQKYYNEYLSSAKMQTFLTINKEIFKNKNLFKELNRNINVTFTTKQEQTGKTNQDTPLFIKDRGNTSDVYYLVETGDIKNDTILKIISKLFTRHSNAEQENINNYIYKEQKTYSDIDNMILKKNELENQFLTIAGRKYISTINLPLTLKNKDLETPLLSCYYTMPVSKNCTDKIKLINEQKELFEKLLNTDLSNDIEEIKTAYKNYIAYSLTEAELPSISNKEMINLKANIFNIYETIDSITENDIKDYLETYFYKTTLSNNYISLPEIKIPHTAQEVTSNFIPKTEKAEKLDLPNIHVFEYTDTNLRVIINADENIMTVDNPYEIMTEENCTILDEPQVIANIYQQDKQNFNLVQEGILQKIWTNRLKDNSNDISVSSFNTSFYTTLTNTINKISIADINKIIFDENFTQEEFDAAKKELIDDVKSNDSMSSIFFNSDELKTNEEVITEIENLSINEFKIYADNYIGNISMDVTVIVSKDYYNEHKNEILSILNKNITCRLKDSPKEAEVTKVKVNNTRLPEEINAEQFIYPLPYNDLKTHYTENFAIMIANSLLESEGYSIETDMDNLPINLKNDTTLHFEYKYCKITPIDNEKRLTNADFLKIKKILEDITLEDLSEIITYLKDWQKNRFETAFSKPLMPMIKAYELMQMYDNTFSCYETIDSITEDDVKNYINIYLINQQPFIEETN